MSSTTTQATGVGTDLCMVGGSTTVGKTKVPTTQRSLAVAGVEQDAKVTVELVNVCVNVDRQLKY